MPSAKANPASSGISLDVGLCFFYSFKPYLAFRAPSQSLSRWVEGQRRDF